MFDYIGEKIKTLAMVCCGIGVCVYAIAGIILIFSGEVGYGVITLIFGPLISWIGCFFMYGFGELIDKVCDIHAVLTSLQSHDENNKSIEEIRAEVRASTEKYGAETRNSAQKYSMKSTEDKMTERDKEHSKEEYERTKTFNLNSYWNN